MDERESLRIVEALLFVSDDPITAQRIAEILECEKREAKRLVEVLTEKYDSNGRAVSIREIAGGYQLRTKTDLAPWIRKYLASRPVRLSRAALEVLAVVAYRQPLTRHEIESIRGVDCSAVLQSLLERKLLKIMGRKDVPGRPIIYGTTRQFLEHFNLADLSELPTLREFAEPPGGHARPGGPDDEGGAEAAGEGEEAGEGEAGAEPPAGPQPGPDETFARSAGEMSGAGAETDEEDYDVDESEIDADETGEGEAEEEDEDEDQF